MPTPVTTNLDTGKHWTLAEKAARQSATEGIKRTRRVMLKAPDWLSEDALIVWKSVVKRLKGIELLDNLDTELLAVYCDAYVNYRKASKALAVVEGFDPELAKAAQAWARIVTTYAEKLGLTPGGRARLAKHKSEKIADPFAEAFG